MGNVKIHKLYESVIWTNPKPVLRSWHSCFPFACELDDGTILASHVIGEAFESVDGTTRLSVSHDRGRTWELMPVVYDKSNYVIKTTDYLKIVSLGGGDLLLFGIEYFREDPERTIGNPENGGLVDNRIVLLRSSDRGESWSEAEEVPCRWGHHVEATAPVTVLKNGDWATPITEFIRWDGSFSGSLCGRLLRSSDQGKTWSDDTIAIYLGDDITAYEQRMCQLEPSGNLVVISWNENWRTGERFNNHYAISEDNGKTFSDTFDTGIRGQASSVCALTDDRLLSLHAVRRDTDRPGIYLCIVNMENGKWEIEEQSIVWEPAAPIVKDTSMAEIFSFLKFGQPGAIRLKDGTILMTHWVIENGQGKTIATAFSIG